MTLPLQFPPSRAPAPPALTRFGSTSLEIAGERCYQEPVKSTPMLLRRGILFGAPLGYIVLGLIHPDDPDVGDDATFFIYLHVVQLFLIGLVAYALWLLVEGVESRAATVTRIAIVPYAVFYANFDALAGIATGLIAQEGGNLGAEDGAVVQQLLDNLGEEPILGIFYLLSGLSWLVAAAAAALALRDRAPAWVTVVMLLGAVVFAVAHPWPPGPIGMTLYLFGIAWHELRPRERPQEVAAPVPS
jgi:hypothetical protein